jgi:hypothetical protein
VNFTGRTTDFQGKPIAGIFVRYFLAAWSTTTRLLASCAVFAFFLVAWGGGWLGATVWRAHKCRRFTAVFSGVLTAAFAISRIPPLASLSRRTLGSASFQNARKSLQMANACDARHRHRAFAWKQVLWMAKAQLSLP